MLYIVSAICVFVLVAIDKFTKYLADAHLQPVGEYHLIEGFFSLSYNTNAGAGFGILQGQWIFLSVASVVILAGLGYFYVMLPKHVPQNRVRWFMRAAVVLVVGGAIGNLIDRVTPPHRVTDFFYFSLIDFPVFNMADVFIVCGGILMAVLMLFFVKENVKKTDV
jgi:signal peptidase II